jgi:outer membrane protein OmpA-like peptidoglycan-associated protein
MDRSIRRIGATLGLAAAAGLLASCATQTGTVLDDKRLQGAVIGAAAGAATGAAVSKHDGKAAGIGAAVGALAGAGIGHYLENKERAAQELEAIPDADVAIEGDSVVVSFAGEVMFDSGSRNLSTGALSRLDSVATTLNRFPDSEVIVQGHTDSNGPEDANLRLSEDRALMVKNQLVLKGVDAYRLTTLGFGESKPLVTNATPEGRAQNRAAAVAARAPSEPLSSARCRAPLRRRPAACASPRQWGCSFAPPLHVRNRPCSCAWSRRCRAPALKASCTRLESRAARWPTRRTRRHST